MSVNPVDVGGAIWQPQQQSSSNGRGQGDWQNILDAASSALGVSSGSVEQQLQSGSSLSSIAQSEGVSQQTVVGAITSAIQQNEQSSGASGPSSARLSEIATNIADRTAGSGSSTSAGGGASGAGQTSPWQTVLTAASSVLG